MPQISKEQAITLLAQKYDAKREVGETDTQLVVRIRNSLRTRMQDRLTEQFVRIDDNLKKEVLEQYYIANPNDEETVEDF